MHFKKKRRYSSKITNILNNIIINATAMYYFNGLLYIIKSQKCHTTRKPKCAQNVNKSVVDSKEHFWSKFVKTFLF